LIPHDSTDKITLTTSLWACPSPDGPFSFGAHMNDFESSRYEGPDRREPRTFCPAAPSVSEAQISLMIEEELERRLGKFEDKMLVHMDMKFAQMHKLLSDAFPNGDPHRHRMAHEREDSAAEGWNRIKGEIVAKFLTGGLWVAAAWLAFAVWQAFKSEVIK
jgi:hypothetical protein